MFSGIFQAIEAAVKFVRVWGKLLAVAGPALAAVWYSPWFKQFFLGIAVGAAVMFSVQYTEIFSTPKDTPLCINPDSVPGGPVKRCWHRADPSDPRDIGFWGDCDE